MNTSLGFLVSAFVVALCLTTLAPQQTSAGELEALVGGTPGVCWCLQAYFCPTGCTTALYAKCLASPDPDKSCNTVSLADPCGGGTGCGQQYCEGNGC